MLNSLPLCPRHQNSRDNGATGANEEMEEGVVAEDVCVNF